ncbi:MAG TPA: hypothetical protein VK855_00415 [Thioalkalivibrio sp.]|nr:hypothetical protein [Thioalkalivibrio sp.]
MEQGPGLWSIECVVQFQFYLQVVWRLIDEAEKFDVDGRRVARPLWRAREAAAQLIAENPELRVNCETGPFMHQELPE